MTETVVDYATPADFDGVMALLRLMHAEQSLFALDEEKVAGLVNRCLARDKGIGGVVRVDGKPVAVVGIVIESFWWTSDPCLIEQFNFVHPDHRRTDYARRLIDFAKSCSDRLADLKLPLFIGVFDLGSRTGAKLRFYQRKLTPNGAFFSHNMEWVEQHVR